MRLFSDIGEFFIAVVTAWAALVTGGVVVAVLFTYEKLAKRDVPSWVYAAFIAAALFTACFLVWRGEHRALLAERSARQVNVDIRFLKVVIGTATEKQRIVGLGITPLLWVGSRGPATSVLINWRLRAVLTNGQTVAAEMLPGALPPAGLPLAAGLRTLKIEGEPLSDHLAIHAVPVGDAVTGYLRFIVLLPTHADPRLLNGAKLVLTCEDLFGGKHEAESTVAGPAGEQDYLHVPGVQSHVTSPRQMKKREIK